MRTSDVVSAAFKGYAEAVTLTLEAIQKCLDEDDPLTALTLMRRLEKDHGIVTSVMQANVRVGGNNAR
jgi:hypothetical protein